MRRLAIAFIRIKLRTVNKVFRAKKIGTKMDATSSFMGANSIFQGS